MNDFDIERRAKDMAASAGIVWDQLSSYPGFERGRWRDHARRVLRREQDGNTGSLH